MKFGTLVQHALGYKTKNDTTFVRMRSGEHPGDEKMSKEGTSLRRT